MNFIAQVEEHLRDLGAEARKKHPGMSYWGPEFASSILMHMTHYSSFI
jgi:hypothetical protein